MPVDLDEPVELASYDARWPGRAEREIERLRPALPGDAAVVHIGSTAAPGCEAKPIVDLLVGSAPGLLAAVARAVEQAGYESLGEAEPGRYYLRRRSPSFNVHVVELDGRLWHDDLLLLELLRSDPEARARYGAAKRRALWLEPNLLGYSREKSRAVVELLAEARRRATRP